MRTSDLLGLLKPFVDRLLTSFCRDGSEGFFLSLPSPAGHLSYLPIPVNLTNIVSLRGNVVT